MTPLVCNLKPTQNRTYLHQTAQKTKINLYRFPPPSPPLQAPSRNKPTQIRTPSWRTPQQRTYRQRGVPIRVGLEPADIGLFSKIFSKGKRPFVVHPMEVLQSWFFKRRYVRPSLTDIALCSHLEQCISFMHLPCNVAYQLQRCLRCRFGTIAIQIKRRMTQYVSFTG